MRGSEEKDESSPHSSHFWKHWSACVYHIYYCKHAWIFAHVVMYCFYCKFFFLMYFFSPSILYLHATLCLLPPAEGQWMQISMTANSSLFAPAQVTDVH